MWSTDLVEADPVVGAGGEGFLDGVGEQNVLISAPDTLSCQCHQRPLELLTELRKIKREKGKLCSVMEILTFWSMAIALRPSYLLKRVSARIFWSGTVQKRQAKYWHLIHWNLLSCLYLQGEDTNDRLVVADTILHFTGVDILSHLQRILLVVIDYPRCRGGAFVIICRALGSDPPEDAVSPGGLPLLPASQSEIKSRASIWVIPLLAKRGRLED